MAVIILLYLQILSALSTFFSRQIQCDQRTRDKSSSAPRCREVLSGVVHLDSDQAFEFESVNLNDNSSLHHDLDIALKIQKSPLLVAYDLDYHKDVAGDISEEVFEYSWAAAAGSGVFQSADFEPKRCSNDVKVPNKIDELSAFAEVERLLSGGRVCGCLETGWGGGRYSGVRRSTLNCNAWPAVFRPSSTTWASRHCPSLIAPIYSVYSLRTWRWEFQIKVSLSWSPKLSGSSNLQLVTAPSVEREFLLNWTQPEVYDDEFDVSFRILFSAPQSGSQPPDLSASYWLLVPKDDLDANETLSDAEDDRDSPAVEEDGSNSSKTLKFINNNENIRQLNGRRSRSLLLPKDMVDLSGKSCDKVGVSLFEWAGESEVNRSLHASAQPDWIAQPEFCAASAGSCLHNQPNSLLQEDRQRLRDKKKPLYMLETTQLPGWSPAKPLLLSSAPVLLATHRRLEEEAPQMDDAASPQILAWPTDVGHSTSLEIMLNATEIAWMFSSAQGVIDDIITHVLDPSRLILVTAVVRNTDTMTSRFALGSTPCTLVPPLGRIDESDKAHFEEDNSFSPSADHSRSLTVTPISKSIAAQHAEAFVISLERPALTLAGTYQCNFKLYDAKGGELDQKSARVLFTERSVPVSAYEKPHRTDANVSRSRVNDIPEDSSIWGGLRAGFGDKQYMIGAGGIVGASSCDCSWANVLCVAMNISECTRRIRNGVASGLMILLGLMAVLICGPNMVKCVMGLGRYMKKRLRMWKVLFCGSCSSGQKKGSGACTAGTGVSTADITPVNNANQLQLAISDSSGGAMRHANRYVSNGVGYGDYSAYGGCAPGLPPPHGVNGYWNMPLPMAATLLRGVPRDGEEGRGNESWSKKIVSKNPPPSLPVLPSTFRLFPTTSEEEDEIEDDAISTRHRHRPREYPTSGSRPSASRPNSSRQRGRSAIASGSDDERQSGGRRAQRYFCWSPPRRRQSDASSTRSRGRHKQDSMNLTDSRSRLYQQSTHFRLAAKRQQRIVEEDDELSEEEEGATRRPSTPQY